MRRACVGIFALIHKEKKPARSHEIVSVGVTSPETFPQNSDDKQGQTNYCALIGNVMAQGDRCRNLTL